MMTIKRYTKQDEDALFALIQSEEDWEEYDTRRPKYRVALERSITYVAFEDGELCGYCRCRDDDGFGVYVYDLLVHKKHRGKQYGKRMMSRVCADFPQASVYVMSDADPYYEKQGYRREGTVFEVKP